MKLYYKSMNSAKYDHCYFYDYGMYLRLEHPANYDINNKRKSVIRCKSKKAFKRKLRKMSGFVSEGTVFTLTRRSIVDNKTGWNFVATLCNGKVK